MSLLTEPAAPIEPQPSKPDDTKGLSQGKLISRRFVSNRLAVVSIVIFVLVAVLSISAIGLGPIPGWWKHNFTSLNAQLNGGAPTLSLVPKWLGGEGISLGEHPFGQSRIGVDYFAMTMRGIQNSIIVMFVIGGIGTVLGTVVGAVAGYYRGWVDSVLMRVTDVFIVIPALVIGAIVGRATGGLGVWLLAFFLALVSWMTIARLVRAEFLSLREREFVEAARVAGASDFRIIFKHILPNAIGVVIVSATLLAAAAILLETALSFLGYGIRQPDVSLGLLISENQSAFQTRPWLYWWPAVFIVLLALLVNFVGDGLRDAFDPRQKRVSLRRMKETP
ncbi:ABC transporter permease [Homoserinimonas hongtaonis]|uniref:ABC transporter permease n=1 Tax=Homoserinimonas hongtaonis TaxID=2079791 RepID=A0A2U1T006_9MICO|nr:ABC transporter permease [Salinibacterium hongtaonis]AWB89736.1 ABC transporter permease [Salinibacterium hongtaonis]PWB97189.1 ABC transporter permease [Salinibacterium hongtaonis]